MEGNNPLDKEIPKSVEDKKKISKSNEEKEKINRNQKIIPKKKKVSKQNINKKLPEIKPPEFLEDELEHPAPLVSDYYEEGKEEIKNDFYQNKLKEKLKNKENNSQISSKILNKMNDLDKNNKIKISDKKINNSSQKNEIIKDTLLSNPLNNNKKNINDKKSEDIDVKEKIIIKENNSPKKNNEINNKNKAQNQHEIPIKKLSKQLNKIPQIKKKNSKKLSHKIIKNSINLNLSSERSENKDSKESINLNKKVAKIKSNNNLVQTISISNISENEHLQNDGQKKLEDINKNCIENKSQINQYINSYQNKDNFQIKKKNNPIKLGKKSHSFSKISYKNDSKNNSQINNNSKIVSNKNEKILLTERINKEEKLNYIKSPIKIPQNDTINSTKIIIKKIPVPINFSKYQNMSNTYKTESNNNLSNESRIYNAPNNYYSNSNISNTVKINNIHNNNCFYNRINEEKENIQDNSQFKKQTYEIGGKFNNIQTTYVVISKKSNINVNLIQKSIKTIDYDNNRYLNTIQSDMYLKSSKFFSPQKNNTILNTDKKTYQNRNYFQYYSENNNYQKTPNNYLLKMNKSQNNINIKKNYNNYYYQNVDKNNYGINFINNVDNTIYANKAQTVDTQYRNTNYLIDKSIWNRGRRIEHFENYYDYSQGHISTDSYLSTSINKNYAY